MRTIGMAMLVLAGLLASAPPADAQSPGLRDRAPTDVSAQRLRRARTRIVVVPSDRLYRQCVDWYQVEHRPSGTVITPQMRCRWAFR